MHIDKKYTQENLPDLSIEFLPEYIHTTIIPKLVKEALELEP